MASSPIDLVQQFGTVLELTAAAQMLVAPSRLLPASKDALKRAMEGAYLSSLAAGSVSQRTLDTLVTGYSSLGLFIDDEQISNQINEAFKGSYTADGVVNDVLLNRYRATLVERDRLVEEFRRFVRNTSPSVSRMSSQSAAQPTAKRDSTKSDYKYFGIASLLLSGFVAFISTAIILDSVNELGDLLKHIGLIIAACIEGAFGYALVSSHRWSRDYAYAVFASIWFGFATPIGLLFLILNLLGTRAARSHSHRPELVSSQHMP